MIRGIEQHQFIFHERLKTDSLFQGRSLDQTDGNLPLDQPLNHFFSIAAPNLQLHPRLLALEASEHSRQHVLRDAGRGPGAQNARMLAIQRRQFLLRHCDKFRHLQRMLLEDAPRWSDHYSPAATIQQPDAQFVLESIDLLRYRRLAQV